MITATTTGGTPGYTYTWDQGLGNGESHTVSPTEETTYTVTVVDSKGCISIDQVTVGIHPDPIADFLPPSGNVCEDEFVTFTAAVEYPDATYIWSFGDGANPATATGFGPHDVLYSTDLGLASVNVSFNCSS